MVPAKSATLERAALYLAGGSAAAVLVSIAVSQILLGAALLTLFIARVRVRFPPVLLPLGVFFVLTLIALAFSPDPRAGIPQVRKFFVYATLLTVFTTFRSREDVRRFVIGATVLGTASGVWSFVQFFLKRREAITQHLDFYLHYVANRATGFMSHWMTFSGLQMIVVLMVASLLIFGAAKRRWWFALAIIASSIAVAWTRSVWLGTAGGAVYLIAVWKPRYLLLAPVVSAVLLIAAPRSVQQRVLSIYQPQQADSNTHRYVTFRTGMEMIKAHPWLGVGPDRVGREFDRYVPADIPKPLPEGYYGHLHNFYLQFAADRGVPAMLAYLWFLAKVLVDSVRGAFRRVGMDRAILHGAVSATIGVMLEGIFEFNVADTEVLTLFLAVIACGYVILRLPEAPLTPE